MTDAGLGLVGRLMGRTPDYDQPVGADGARSGRRSKLHTAVTVDAAILVQDDLQSLGGIDDDDDRFEQPVAAHEMHGPAELLQAAQRDALGLGEEIPEVLGYWSKAYASFNGGFTGLHGASLAACPATDLVWSAGVPSKDVRLRNGMIAACRAPCSTGFARGVSHVGEAVA
jgi:hypothetical protein